jgi:hypothetical protein
VPCAANRRKIEKDELITHTIHIIIYPAYLLEKSKQLDEKSIEFIMLVLVLQSAARVGAV